MAENPIKEELEDAILHQVALLPRIVSEETQERQAEILGRLTALGAVRNLILKGERLTKYLD